MITILKLIFVGVLAWALVILFAYLLTVLGSDGDIINRKRIKDARAKKTAIVKKYYDEQKKLYSRAYELDKKPYGKYHLEALKKTGITISPFRGR